jgi:predicted RNA-binding protein YlqC (UPF0109 family)
MAASIDQQFIEYIVKSIVGNPDAVKIDRRIDEKGVLLELTVDAEDLGRVIGKRGATAQSLRTLLRALGTKNDARYNLKIIDVGGPRPPRQSDDDQSSPPTDDTPPDDTMSADETTEEVTVEETAIVEDTSSDDAVEDARAEELVEDKPTENKKEPSSDLASRTRAELADLDDLDV